MRTKAESILSLVESSDKEILIQRGKMIGEHTSVMNCQLFAATLTKSSNIKSLKEIKKPAVGSVLRWGTGSHYAVYLGDGEVIQVPEWHSPVEVVSLDSVTKDFGDEYTVYQPTTPIKELSVDTP